MSLYFLDIETTGLHPTRCKILEIAVCEVSPVLEPLRAYHAVIHQEEADLEKLQLIGDIDPYVLKMHTDNGLWLDCMASTRGFAEVYRELMIWLGRGPHTLAGDSVHFDREFLRWQMPDVWALFSHRLLDLSAFRVAREVCGLPMDSLGVGGHRACGDVEASIARARWHLSRLAT